MNNPLRNPEFVNLLRGALENPADNGPAKVLSDWLTENGMGELGLVADAMPVWWPFIVEKLSKAMWELPVNPTTSTPPLQPDAFDAIARRLGVLLSDPGI